MRLYHRTQDDKINGIRRCFFEAKHSRVSLALERLRDLGDELPGDPQVFYAEGLLRIENLGQGVAAGGLFQRAFQADSTHIPSLVNAVKFARDEREFRRWADIACRAKPDDRTLLQFVTNILNGLDSGVAYWEILARGSEQNSEAARLGESAALMELALQAGGMPPDQEVSARHYRAQSLRTLDEEAHRYRTTLAEAFLPEERLALHEALSELEKALAIDEYDPEVWNLKTAWCSLLARYEEAVDASDRAIELRPMHYHRAHQNKAVALWGLGKREQALGSAEEALRQAESTGSAEDIERVRRIIGDYSAPARPLDWSEWEDKLAAIIKAAQIVSEEEIGQREESFQELVKGVLGRGIAVSGNRSLDFVPIMAELLSDFVPETVLRIMHEVTERNAHLYGHCLNAALYVAAYSDGVRQRDAARFLAFIILGAVEVRDIRRVYRQAILETSAAATNEMSRLDTIMRAELSRINPMLLQVIADQEPVDEEGKARAASTILSSFSGSSPKPGKWFRRWSSS